MKHAQIKKINPYSRKPEFKLDGTPNYNDRVEIGPTQLAFDEWIKADLKIPNLQNMREFRVSRLVNEINKRKLDGVLVFDPLNIRYITDTTNMQLWNSHNPFRACFISDKGYIILWDYKGLDLLSSFNPLVKEVRNSASMFYFANGDNIKNDAVNFANEIKDILSKNRNNNLRLAVDKIQIHGLRALENLGINVLDGEEVMERTRAIKGEEVIAFSREITNLDYHYGTKTEYLILGDMIDDSKMLKMKILPMHQV